MIVYVKGEQSKPETYTVSQSLPEGVFGFPSADSSQRFRKPKPPRESKEPEKTSESDPSTPAWWYRDTPPTDVELDEFLKTARIWFMGQRLTEDDIEEAKDYLRLKWEREKRKREREKKEREKGNTDK